MARSSLPRFAFLYYYQVFEYAGYSYINEKIKRSLRIYLRDPSLINCGEAKVTELFAILSESNLSDDVKMRKVIEDNCDPSIIWKEIVNDKECFSNTLNFDGGFVLPPLISNDTTQDAWLSMWTPKLFDQFTRIRNSLVHAREQRQYKVILPTKLNNRILERLLPIIRRTSEQIALKALSDYHISSL